MTKVELYGNLPKMSNMVQMRRLRSAEYYSRLKNQSVYFISEEPGKYALHKGSTLTYALQEFIALFISTSITTPSRTKGL
jgi:hypothetical protein